MSRNARRIITSQFSSMFVQCDFISSMPNFNLSLWRQSAPRLLNKKIIFRMCDTFPTFNFFTRINDIQQRELD